MPQTAGERGLRRAEGAIGVEAADLRLAARRLPERLAAGLVEVAEQAAGGVALSPIIRTA